MGRIMSRLRGCEAARLRGCEAARLRGCEAARLRGCEAARLRILPDALTLCQVLLQNFLHAFCENVCICYRYVCLSSRLYVSITELSGDVKFFFIFYKYAGICCLAPIRIKHHKRLLFKFMQRYNKNKKIFCVIIL